jgi:phospholipid transport system substrate-binding protein
MTKVLIALSMLAFTRVAVAQEDPQTLVARLIGDVEVVLASQEPRDAKLKLIEEKVVPHMDFEEATRLAAARAWSEASAEQRSKLVREFRAMLTRTYSSAIDAYAGQKLRPLPSRIHPASAEASVRYQFIRSGGRPVQVSYELHRRGTSWKIYDISVEGMSLVLTYRTEFDNVLKQEGIDGLIRRLAQKNAPAAIGLQTVR